MQIIFNVCVYYKELYVKTEYIIYIYRISHFKQSNQISRKLSPIDKNVSDKRYIISKKLHDENMDLTLNDLSEGSRSFPTS